MPLTTDEMQRIIVDELNGDPPRDTGRAANRFRRAIRPDIELAEERGWVIDVPAEWEVE